MNDKKPEKLTNSQNLQNDKPDSKLPMLLPDSSKKAEHQNYISVREFFILMDDFQRAIDAAKKKQSFEAIIEGMELIYYNFVLILKTHNIEPFSDKYGPFDPERHEIIEGDYLPPEMKPVIDKVYRDGFKQGCVILRKALVSIRPGQKNEVEN